MQITEQQALDLLYYGKTRDGQLSIDSDDRRLDLAFELSIDNLCTQTLLNGVEVKSLFSRRLTAIANLHETRPIYTQD